MALESNNQFLWNNPVMNLPSGAIVRKGMVLFQEQGDACMAMSREQDSGGEWHMVTAKPVSRCQHALLAFCEVLHKGACEIRGPEFWRKGRASLRICSQEAELTPDLVA